MTTINRGCVHRDSITYARLTRSHGNSSQVNDAKTLEEAFTNSNRNLRLVPLQGENLVDRVWSSDLAGAAPRPPPPTQPARQLPMSVAGKALSDKLAAVADEARKAKADGYLAIALDEVCDQRAPRTSDGMRTRC
eukprot:6179814-Pleurochrysis_carterae.AAC.1